jgi:hypothetical protein
MRKLVAVVASALVILGISGCGPQGVAVPDVSGTDSATANSVLSSLGLIPVEKISNSDEVEIGKVIGTSPPVGTVVDAGSRVEVLVSSGPRIIQSKDSTISWYNVSYSMDDWNFSNPTIEDGVLNIEVSSVIFMANVEWRDDNNTGEGFGNASISDTFDKSVPIRIVYDTQSNGSGESQSIVLKIPVTDLEVQRPTTVYLELFANVNGVKDTIELSFNMSW